MSSCRMLVAAVNRVPLPPKFKLVVMNWVGLVDPIAAGAGMVTQLGSESLKLKSVLGVIRTDTTLSSARWYSVENAAPSLVVRVPLKASSTIPMPADDSTRECPTSSRLPSTNSIMPSSAAHSHLPLKCFTPTPILKSPVALWDNPVKPARQDHF